MRKLVKFAILDKSYIAMKKIPIDVIQKGKKVTKQLCTAFEHLRFVKMNSKSYMTSLVTFFPIFNDVIRNLFHSNIGFIRFSIYIYK